MGVFSATSIRRLNQCHPELQRLAKEAIRLFDFAIATGHRSVGEQQALYAQGRTKPGPIVTKVDGMRVKSKHNYDPSLAFDFVPYIQATGEYDWNNRERFCVAGGIFLGLADQMDISIRWGGNWNNDDQFSEDGDDWDLPHIELYGGDYA